MCGIVGTSGASPGLLENALRSLKHRGPDADGVWLSDAGFGLGHARLSIIDLDAHANQPMVCPRTGNVITFNGEIYNFRALRRELEQAGWDFQTRSDTEVLLAAYGEWGVECLARLNGMFAFAIYDSRRREILLARDRVGKKPLYYTLHNGLAWSSELKGLLALRPDLPRVLDQGALKSYMELGNIPGEQTIYQTVRKLPPAHYALYNLDNGVYTQRRFWLLPCPSMEVTDEDEAAEELEALVKDAVRIRLESDVPLGAFLSGGLDSSLVAALMAKENPSLVAYTVQFPVAALDESAHAAAVARWIGVDHRVLPAEAEAGSLLDKLAWQFDEPFDDSSLVPTYLVSRAIRAHVKVALSGDGGDELFAGYDHYARVLSETRLDKIPIALRRPLSALHRIVPASMRGKSFLWRLSMDGITRFLSYGAAPGFFSTALLRDEVQRELAAIDRDTVRQQLLRRLNNDCEKGGLSLLQTMTRIDFHAYLPDDILVKVDRASMLTSLEVRAPLLDYRIAEFAFRLPDQLRLQGVTRKYLLKKIARKYLPPDFAYQRKQGFSAPEADWFRGPWRDLLMQVLPHSSLLDPKRVHAMLDMHQRAPRYGRALFRALTLAQFERIWTRAS